MDVTSGMSGGWSKTFSVEESADTWIDLRYRLVMNGYDADECAQVLVSIDGGEPQVLAGLCGRDKETGWQSASISQYLSAGSHTLTIGGFNNKKTGPAETAEIYFDDVSISGESTGEPEPEPEPEPETETNCSNGIDDDGDGLIDCDDPDCEGSADCATDPTSSASFDSGTEGFTYADDTFNGTHWPAYASGQYTASGGYNGSGGLRVTLGGVDGVDVTSGMSGGWSKTFSVEESADTWIGLRYRLVMNGYDADECAQVLVSIDGGEPQVLAGLCGRDKETGWQSASISQYLSAGSHTLTIGGFNNKKTGPAETAEIYFDDVSISGESTGEPEPEPEPETETNCSNGIDDDGDGLIDCDDPDCEGSADCATDPTSSASFDSGTEGFTYADDTFNGTHWPAYASGQYTSSGGYNGSGGLRVTLGGVDGVDVTSGMSGGWSKTFSVEESADTWIDLRYRLVMNGYDADECAQVLVSIDGGEPQVLAGLCGRGQETGWQSASISQYLSAGSHTLTIGGFNNKKTGPAETAEIYFDDLEID